MLTTSKGVDMSTVLQRRLPVGAEPIDEGVHFRVWAPRRKRVDVVIEGSRAIALERESNGYFSGDRGICQRGHDLPIPAGWRRSAPCRIRHLDISPKDRTARRKSSAPSLTVGTTRRGEASALRARSFMRCISVPSPLKERGLRHPRSCPNWQKRVSRLLEIMPVADFPGDFGWGYDGVDLFAPTHLYGTPDDFRSFVDQAHSLGLGVILDVVYNHFGPDGNYLKQFSDHYFTDRYANEWGEAINFDGPDCGPVRDFFISNVRVLDRRFSSRWLETRCNATDFRPVTGTYPCRYDARGPAGGRQPAVSSSSRKMNLRMRRLSEMPNTAGTDSMRSGMMIFITA